MIDNEKEDYIVLRKDLYNKYGLRRGMIVQLLINNGGEFIGTIGAMQKIILISSYDLVKTNIKELENMGVISREQISGYTYRFFLNDYGKKVTTKNEASPKREVPESVRKHVDAIRKIRNEKYKIEE